MHVKNSFVLFMFFLTSFSLNSLTINFSDLHPNTTKNAKLFAKMSIPLVCISGYLLTKSCKCNELAEDITASSQQHLEVLEDYCLNYRDSKYLVTGNYDPSLYFKLSKAKNNPQTLNDFKKYVIHTIKNKSELYSDAAKFSTALLSGLTVYYIYSVVRNYQIFGKF